MGITKIKPTSSGARFTIRNRDSSLSKNGPLKKLTVKKKKRNGRNNAGRITVRHQGGSHKRKYRIIDFKRDKDDIVAKIESVEYDPNRSSNIALLLYKDGERRYIIAPRNNRVGDIVLSGIRTEISTGNCMPIQNIPLGTLVHNLELKPGKGAQIGRSAGSSIQVVSKDKQYAIVRLRSGELRKVLLSCRAVIGSVSNASHNLSVLGKAGAKRWRGIRPTVRGVAMNPVDHPHGGGEGKTSGGRHPVSPWALPTKGKKTRSKKYSDHLIVKRRRRK